MAKQDVSMVCYACEAWTKDYDDCGRHVCGEDVFSGGEPVDLDYEGPMLSK